MAGSWTPDATERALAALREAAGRYERPAELGALEITITPVGVPDLGAARRCADLGVDRLTILPPSWDGPAMDELIAKVGDSLVGRV